jgi:peptidylprolyl isomerase
MSSRFLVASSLLAAGVIAGCGSSNTADTAHVKLPPTASQTLTYSATSTSTSSTSTAPAISTPKSGPLSTEPKITAPKTAPPKALVTKDIITGTGAVAATGDTLVVNYVGALYKTGTVFDASWLNKQTFTVPGPLGSGSVIKGWDQGLVGMHVGGRRELIIPPALAYGSKAGGVIPANSTLIFIVDLLAVNPPSGATGATAATGATGATAATGATGASGATG